MNHKYNIVSLITIKFYKYRNCYIKCLKNKAFHQITIAYDHNTDFYNTPHI